MNSRAVTLKQRRDIVARDHATCARCGKDVSRSARSIHHRRNRGMGGTTRLAPLSELVLLCGTGTTGCHGEITENPTEAYATGWAIRRSEPDTADMIPMQRLDGSMFTLTDDGDVLDFTLPKDR